MKRRLRLVSDLRILIALLILISLLPGFVLITFRFQEDSRRRIDEFQKEVAYYVRWIARDEQRTFEATRDLLLLLARSPQLLDRNECGEFLKGLSQQYSRYSGLVLADLQGNIYCSGTGAFPQVNIANQPYFQQAIRSRSFATGGFAMGRISGLPVVHSAYPILGPSGQIRAIVIASFPLAEMNNLSGMLPIGMLNAFTLTKVDQGGNVLAHQPPTGEWIIGNIAPELQFGKEILAKDVNVFTGRSTNGEPFIYASSPVEADAGTTGFYVILGIPQSLAMTEINGNFQNSIVALLVAAFVGLIFVLILAHRYVLRPVDALLTVSRRVLEGDYSARTGGPYDRAQLGQLTQLFDDMAATIDRRAKERSEAESKFRLFLESAPDAVVIVDRSGRIVLTNKQTENLFQYSREELIGNTVEMLMPEGFREGHIEYRERFVGKPAMRPMGAGLNLQGRRKDGSEFPVEISLSPVGTGEGGVVLSAIRDISERKLLEDELRNTASRLRSLAGHLQVVREEERFRIAREIHDELGQSLSGLKLDLYSATRRLPATETFLAEKIHSSIERVDSIISDVKRIASELRPGLLELGLSTAIESLVEEFQSRNEIHCHLRLPPSEIPLDEERRLAVFRILQETLTNVARHSGATNVEIVLRQGSRDMLLEVRDDGIGTAPGERHHESLGIMGMRERSHLLGGTFEIQATPGKGTVVRVVIPLSI